MAVTETVKIVFASDTKGLTDTIDELVKLKKITEEEAASLKKLTEAFGNTSKTVGDTTNSFVSLRGQVKQAKEEVQKMADQFGESSVQFQQARLRAGQLADQMEDLNRIVKLSNPEAQAQAFVNFGNSVLGAFQIATGALQAFGVENEKLQKIATRLQGALNLTQGVASIGKLKESFADLKIILGLTATAQGGLNKATDSGINASEILKQTQTSTTLALNASKIATGELTAVTNAASTAWARFTAVLARNPLTFLAVAIAAVAGAYLVLSKNTNDAAKSVDNLAETKKKLNNAQEKSIENAANESAELKILIERVKLAKNSSLEREEVLQEINKKYGTTLKNISDENELLKQLDATYIKLTETIQKKALAAAIEDELKEIYAEQVKLELESIRNQEKIAEKRKESAMNANLDNVAAANFQKNLLTQVETLNKSTTDNRKKQLQESIDFLSKELAATASGIDATYAKNKQEEIKLIKTLGVEASKSQSELLSLSEEAFNRLQMVYAILESSPLEVAKSLEKVNEELDKIGPKTVEITTTSSDLNKKAFAEQDKRAELSKELFAETQDFILSLSAASFERQQQDLEQQKEKGIITEEQYQEKLKKIKQNQARQDKELAIFAATVSLAEAIVKALTIKPPASFAAAATTAAIAGLNLAKIIATPLPKFKQGTLSVPGTDTGQDTVMAMLRPGEAVIPTETNREYAPALRAIYRRDINAKELNDFVTNREQGAFAFNQVSLDALYKRDLKVSALTQAGKSAQLTSQPTKITADVDVQQLTRAMSKNKAVEVTNTAALGEAIAAQLSKRINPRQVI